MVHDNDDELDMPPMFTNSFQGLGQPGLGNNDHESPILGRAKGQKSIYEPLQLLGSGPLGSLGNLSLAPHLVKDTT